MSKMRRKAYVTVEKQFELGKSGISIQTYGTDKQRLGCLKISSSAIKVCKGKRTILHLNWDMFFKAVRKNLFDLKNVHLKY